MQKVTGSMEYLLIITKGVIFMEIDANVYNLINILFQVILWSLIVSSPLIILTIEMYAYEKYKKWKNTEAQEYDRIILGKAESKADLVKQIESLTHEKRDLEVDVKLLNKEKTGLQKILGVEEENPEVIERHQPIDTIYEIEEENPEVSEDPIGEKKPLEEMNMKQLQELAREYKIKWYSRMKKKVLIETIKPYYHANAQ